MLSAPIIAVIMMKHVQATAQMPQHMVPLKLVERHALAALCCVCCCSKGYRRSKGATRGAHTCCCGGSITAGAPYLSSKDVLWFSCASRWYAKVANWHWASVGSLHPSASIFNAVQVCVTPALRERHLGCLQGLTLEEAHRDPAGDRTGADHQLVTSLSAQDHQMVAAKVLILRSRQTSWIYLPGEHFH
jgi:hypothetical protein